MAAVAWLATPARAQDVSTDTLQVGDVAPDFTLPGATREGLMEQPIRLSDFRGQTVVLAFFFQARTRG
jgi:peroxiredoxin